MPDKMVAHWHNTIMQQHQRNWLAMAGAVARCGPDAWGAAGVEALVSWVALNAGGSGLAVGAVPQATCHACFFSPGGPPHAFKRRKKLEKARPLRGQAV
jgi:hypothetical protein